jgi:urease accessory protein
LIAKLHIQTRRKGNLTRLSDCYCTAPLKLADITEHRQSGTLDLMIMNASPGILDGDQYELKLQLDQGCCVQLQTQSYQRLFHMKSGASQTLKVELDRGASFFYLPHPSSPHAGSIFRSANSFYLGEDCRLLFGEVLACGRKLNGESFAFSSYHTVTEVYISGRLVLKENLLLQPMLRPVDVIGQMEGFSHQGSLICLDPGADISLLLPRIIEMVSQQDNIVFGVSETAVNGLVLRLLGHKAEQLHECIKAVACLFRRPKIAKSTAHAV